MAFITEDSDGDSISLTSTVDSEHSEDTGFNVEQILAEAENDQGIMMYLVKWEGYPMDRCTWEDKDQFGSDIPLNTWRQRKREAARGGESLFDIDDFNAAFEKAADEKEARQERRKARRKRRGEMLSRSHTPVGTATRKTAPSRGTGAASPVEKKGIAQKVNKSTTAQAAPKPAKAKAAPSPALAPSTMSATKPARSNATLSQPARKTAPVGNLLGADVPPLKRKQKARVSGDTPKDSAAPKFRSLSEQNRYQSYSRNHPAPDMNALPLIDPKTGKRMSSQKRPVEPIDQLSEPVASATLMAMDRRPSQPQVAKAVPAQTANQTQPTADKLADPAASVPSTSTAAVQTKSNAQPERARRPTQPAPKPKPMVAIPQPTASRHTETQSAYGRRTPPVERRQRSPSPRAPPPKPQSAVHPSELPLGHPKRQVCSQWKTGGCQFTADTCMFAHSYINAIPKTKAITCYYWRNGDKCNKTAEQCGFAHHDTGQYAGRPGTFFSRVRSGQYPGTGPSANEIAFNSEKRQQHVASPVIEESLPDQMDVEPVPKATEPATNPSMTPWHYPAHTAGLLNKEAEVTAFPASHIQDEFPLGMQDEDEDDSKIECGLALAKKSIQGLDVNPFLYNKDNKPIEHVYILMSPEREAERQLLVDFFQGFNCKVYHSGNPQHWNFFRKLKNPTLAVIHPRETFLGTLPDFASYLWRGKGWVFSFGVHEDWEAVDAPKRIYEARRAFPHAGITFLTDDVFSYYPEKATEIIEEFHAKAKSKPAGSEFSKIGARPGIRDWLAKLAEKKMEDGGEGYADDRYVKCWDAICDLCPIQDYDPFEMERGRMVPNREALLWSEAEQDLPSLQGLWDTDEAAATDKMANFFAGTAVDRMWEFQRYSFIYQRPAQTAMDEDAPASQLDPQAVIDQIDPHGWMRKYNHIEVMTPDTWLHRFRTRT